MIDLWSLWLPMLAAGIAAHVASTIAWTALPHHKPEWRPLPDEATTAAKLKGLQPGQYIFPALETPPDLHAQVGFQGMFVLWPTKPNMGQNILFTVIYFLVASFCIGYLASLALPAGAEFMHVFRFVGAAALLTFCGTIFPHAIWFKRRVAMEFLDGVAFALIVGVIYAWLWPAATAA